MNKKYLVLLIALIGTSSVVATDGEEGTRLEEPAEKQDTDNPGALGEAEGSHKEQGAAAPAGKESEMAANEDDDADEGASLLKKEDEEEGASGQGAAAEEGLRQRLQGALEQADKDRKPGESDEATVMRALGSLHWKEIAFDFSKGFIATTALVELIAAVVVEWRFHTTQLYIESRATRAEWAGYRVMLLGKYGYEFPLVYVPYMLTNAEVKKEEKYIAEHATADENKEYELRKKAFYDADAEVTKTRKKRHLEAFKWALLTGSVAGVVTAANSGSREWREYWKKHKPVEEVDKEKTA